LTQNQQQQQWKKYFRTLTTVLTNIVEKIVSPIVTLLKKAFFRDGTLIVCRSLPEWRETKTKMFFRRKYLYFSPSILFSPFGRYRHLFTHCKFNNPYPPQPGGKSYKTIQGVIYDYFGVIYDDYGAIYDSFGVNC